VGSLWKDRRHESRAGARGGAPTPDTIGEVEKVEQADKKAVVHPAGILAGSGFQTVDRAAASGAVGRGFKSLRARQ